MAHTAGKTDGLMETLHTYRSGATTVSFCIADTASSPTANNNAAASIAKCNAKVGEARGKGMGGLDEVRTAARAVIAALYESDDSSGFEATNVAGTGTDDGYSLLSAKALGGSGSTVFAAESTANAIAGVFGGLWTAAKAGSGTNDVVLKLTGSSVSTADQHADIADIIKQCAQTLELYNGSEVASFSNVASKWEAVLTQSSVIRGVNAEEQRTVDKWLARAEMTEKTNEENENSSNDKGTPRSACNDQNKKTRTEESTAESETRDHGRVERKKTETQSSTKKNTALLGLALTAAKRQLTSRRQASSQ
ncbi:hypothetical protein TRVL_04009 [Trypanosoma vivax]|nr:hypothetical protein TRVL_04009 [Trypanosoma vivax]